MAENFSVVWYWSEVVSINGSSEKNHGEGTVGQWAVSVISVDLGLGYGHQRGSDKTHLGPCGITSWFITATTSSC
jgi:hypothetical protein